MGGTPYRLYHPFNLSTSTNGKEQIKIRKKEKSCMWMSFAKPTQTPWIDISRSSHVNRTLRICMMKRNGFSVESMVEGPSCIFVGPVETAKKETLEALYRQARDAYYSGKPLIVDDMFDKVELKLRWYGSKSVVKYPRCSLRRQSTYADAEEDPSQFWALASVWLLLLVFGTFAFLLPTFYLVGLSFNSRIFSNTSEASFESLAMFNRLLFIAIGSVIASASVGALQRLWKNDLVALKGACPNCGEEVFAFVGADQSNQTPHTADCHVCECSLEFRPKVEESISRPGKQWVYGRIYLLRQKGRNRQK